MTASQQPADDKPAKSDEIPTALVEVAPLRDGLLRSPERRDPRVLHRREDACASVILHLADPANELGVADDEP